METATTWVDNNTTQSCMFMHIYIYRHVHNMCVRVRGRRDFLQLYIQHTYTHGFVRSKTFAFVKRSDFKFMKSVHFENFMPHMHVYMYGCGTVLLCVTANSDVILLLWNT